MGLGVGVGVGLGRGVGTGVGGTDVGETDVEGTVGVCVGRTLPEITTDVEILVGLGIGEVVVLVVRPGVKAGPRVGVMGSVIWVRPRRNHKPTPLLKATRRASRRARRMGNRLRFLGWVMGGVMGGWVVGGGVIGNRGDDDGDDVGDDNDGSCGDSFFVRMAVVISDIS